MWETSIKFICEFKYPTNCDSFETKQNIFFTMQFNYSVLVHQLHLRRFSNRRLLKLSLDSCPAVKCRTGRASCCAQRSRARPAKPVEDAWGQTKLCLSILHCPVATLHVLPRSHEIAYVRSNFKVQTSNMKHKPLYRLLDHAWRPWFRPWSDCLRPSKKLGSSSSGWWYSD